MLKDKTQTDFLDVILERKRSEVEEAERKIPQRVLRERAEHPREHRSLYQRLKSVGMHGVNIIAEIKRGSPSKGIIRADLEPDALAQAYERGGAAALSVLTDAAFFWAKEDDLTVVRSATRLPVLRKDFILSDYQIYESAVMGADAVLLIVRAVSAGFLKDALALCRELGLDALVEVHSRPELEIATEAGARLVGINNRDLKTFKTDLGLAIALSPCLDKSQVAVSESGIRTRNDVERLKDAGIYNFLIGESLVRSDDPAKFLADLLGCRSQEEVVTMS